MSSSLSFELLLFFLLTLIAEILGTLGGFGSSLFFVPLSQFFFDFQTVLALTGLLHVFSNTAKIILFRKTIDWKIVAGLGISSVLLAIGGALLMRYVAIDYAGLLLGLFLMVFSGFLLMYPKFAIPVSVRNSLLSGSAAGFLAGFIGTGGAIRGLALTSFNLEKNLFVGTSSVIDFGVDLSRTIVYLDSGYFSRDRLLYIPLLMIAAALGSYLGKMVLNRIDENRFKTITRVLIFLTGLTLLVQHIGKTPIA